MPVTAPYEVDGQVVRRRNGLVELVGRVGDVFRLRAFKGAKSTEEKSKNCVGPQPVKERVAGETVTAAGAPPVVVVASWALVPTGSRASYGYSACGYL